MNRVKSPQIIILMGVTGSGKTTIGKLLSEQLGWTFYDGDDFHPPANVEKMSAGIALDDQDRVPWLTKLRELALDSISSGQSAIIACSALKAWYRDEFLACHSNVIFFHLSGTAECITKRLAQRKDHFMDPALLKSQFETLEEPEEAYLIDVSSSPEEIAAKIYTILNAI